MNLHRTIFAAAAVGLAALGTAQYVPYELLSTTTDGFKTDVRNILVGTYGPRANVGNAAGTSFGDQVSDRIFSSNGQMTWDYKWSHAGLAGQHRLGYYNLDSPSNITWVLGNKNRDGVQVSSWTGNLTGVFGIVLDNGAGELFYSELSRNSDSLLSSSNTKLNNFDRRNHVAIFQNQAAPGLIMTWEDLKNEKEQTAGGSLDYNDYGYTFQNLKAVPEPGTMIALSAGALALLRRRKKPTR